MAAVRGSTTPNRAGAEAPRWQPSRAITAVRTPARSPQSNGQERGRPANGGENQARTRRPSTASFAKGQEIFQPGQGGGQVYIVRSGFIRLYKTLPDRRSINLGLLGPNTIFAQEDHYDGLSTGATAQAVVDSTLSIIDTEDLAGLISESPDLAVAVVHGMNRRLTELQTLVEQLLLRDTAVRLVTALYTLAKGFGRPTADGLTAITLPLTHQALANMIGSNRVTVTRKLIELQRDGVVRSLGRNAIAVNSDRLRDYARDAGDTK
ncbi:MAG: Crp/Fnr family transcriptional regulator [Chloroflexota bacterium]|nr:Crp/Fnr family transcriptional regulator [Chloroflexota bacterium]